MAMEKRKQHADELRAAREKAAEAMSTEDADVLDSLLEKLRNGDAIGTRKARRNKPSAVNSVPLNLEGSMPEGSTAVTALNMLAQLQSDGFVTPTSPTERERTAQRRRRIRDPFNSDSLPVSPVSNEGGSLLDS